MRNVTAGWSDAYSTNALAMEGKFEPDAESANRVHKEAHGLEADEIFEVTEHS